jgi:hypothetical protein
MIRVHRASDIIACMQRYELASNSSSKADAVHSIA